MFDNEICELYWLAVLVEDNTRLMLKNDIYSCINVFKTKLSDEGCYKYYNSGDFYKQLAGLQISHFEMN